MAKEKKTPEAKEADRKAMRSDLEDYREAINRFNTGAEDIKSAVQDTAGAVGSLGGEVGKLIGNTKAKASANAMMYPTASLVKRAAKNIFEFPVFVSTSVPMDFATATNSLLEQVYASFLQMAISQYPVVSAVDMANGNPFRGLKSDVNRYLEYTDPEAMFYAHDACHNVITTEDAVVEFDMINVDDKMATIVNECLDYRPLSEFDHYFMEADDTPPVGSYAEYKKKKGETDKKSEEAAAKAKKNSDDLDDAVNNAKEAANTAGLRRDIAEHEKERRELQDEIAKLKETGGDISVKDEKYYQRIRDAESRLGAVNRELNELRRDLRSAGLDLNEFKREGEKHNYTQAYKAAEEGRAVAAEDRAQKKEARDVEKHNAEMKDRETRLKIDAKAKAPQFMDETKIQKLNSMKPLMMTVSMRVMEPGRGISDLIDYVVGVKTVCRLVEPEVLPDFAEYPSKTMSYVSRKAKWRAGELKFIDYMFSRKEKKQAAYDSRDPKRKWYHQLYNLAHAKGSAKVAKKLTGSRNPDGLIPCATMILTKADVDMIESANGIDLLKASTASKICRELFMIAMVIIDTDAQSIKILFPEVSTDYEVHSLASVNKQLATLDTSNSVSREVSRMMRER